MSQTLIALEGTDAGLRLAVVLALAAAFLHALFGAMQKGRYDPWLSRSCIDVFAGLIALPLVLFVVPWPEPHMWPIFGAVLAVHIGYKVLMAMAYSRGAYTVVYPVVRGTSPIFTVIGSWLVFGEIFGGGQWLGVVVLVAGIFGLAAYNLRHVTVDRSTLVPALWLAVLTGAFVALYTTVDAYGIRATADPFTFLAWFFLIDSFYFPILWWARGGRLQRGSLWPLARFGLLGAMVAMASFGSIMLATRLGPVGQAAVLRETSILFAALIGWLWLGDRLGPRRLTLMGLIAAGAVIVQATA